MSQQPRFNEERYYRYPKGRIAVVLNETETWKRPWHTCRRRT